MHAQACGRIFPIKHSKLIPLGLIFKVTENNLVLSYPLQIPPVTFEMLLLDSSGNSFPSPSNSVMSMFSRILTPASMPFSKKAFGEEEHCKGLMDYLLQ